MIDPPASANGEAPPQRNKGLKGVVVHRLVRGAWWLAWVSLLMVAALYVGLHIPVAVLILATRDDCTASRWLHDSTDWALDGIWKVCPANAQDEPIRMLGAKRARPKGGKARFVTSIRIGSIALLGSVFILLYFLYEAFAIMEIPCLRIEDSYISIQTGKRVKSI